MELILIKTRQLTVKERKIDVFTIPKLASTSRMEERLRETCDQMLNNHSFIWKS